MFISFTCCALKSVEKCLQVFLFFGYTLISVIFFLAFFSLWAFFLFRLVLVKPVCSKIRKLSVISDRPECLRVYLWNVKMKILTANKMILRIPQKERHKYPWFQYVIITIWRFIFIKTWLLKGMSRFFRFLSRRRSGRGIKSHPLKKKNAITCVVQLLDGTDYTTEVHVSNFCEKVLQLVYNVHMSYLCSVYNIWHFPMPAVTWVISWILDNAIWF